MLYLILSILSNVGILLVFRIAGIRKIHSLAMVVINYITASFAGLTVFLIDGNKFEIKNTSPAFFGATLIIAVMFLLLFLIVQQSSNTSGMAITSAAAKLSVIIPVIVSILIDPLDVLSTTKAVGLLLMFSAVVLIVYNKELINKHRLDLLLPLLLFLGLGIVDSVVKISQQFIIGVERIPIFTLIVFVLAGLCGFVLLTFRKEVNVLFRGKHVVYGIILGILNYGSLIFLVKTLNLNIKANGFFDSSRIFMFNNIGIIIISVFIGVLVFKEKLNPLNYIGMALSLFGFYLLV